MIKVELKDGSKLELEQQMSILEVARKLSEGLARVATCAKVNGEVKEKTFSDEDFAKIEEEMKKIIKEDLPIERYTLPRQEAIKLMQEREEPYKVELIEELPEGEEISFYKQGEFVDLCAGPHLMSTGKVKAVKLLTTSGAYWRGNENNKMLQRIYGISYPKASELEEYLNMLEEAKKRDHKKLGKELELFMIAPERTWISIFLTKGNGIKKYIRGFLEKNTYTKWLCRNKNTSYIK